MSNSSVTVILNIVWPTQIELERTRKRMNKGREKIRQVHLAEEKARREAELAALKAAEEEVRMSYSLHVDTIPKLVIFKKWYSYTFFLFYIDARVLRRVIILTYLLNVVLFYTYCAQSHSDGFFNFIIQAAANSARDSKAKGKKGKKK